MDIQALERRKMQIEVARDARQADLERNSRELEAEGITEATDVDAYIADLTQKRDAAQTKYEELYTEVDQQLSKAEELLRA